MVRALRHRVIDISMGRYHTAVIVEAGTVWSFGRNADGQLGIEGTKLVNTPQEVKAMSDKNVVVRISSDVEVFLFKYLKEYHPVSARKKRKKENQLLFFIISAFCLLPCFLIPQCIVASWPIHHTGIHVITHTVNPVYIRALSVCNSFLVELCGLYCWGKHLKCIGDQGKVPCPGIYFL